MKIFNTLTRNKEELIDFSPDDVPVISGLKSRAPKTTNINLPLTLHRPAGLGAGGGHSGGGSAEYPQKW